MIKMTSIEQRMRGSGLLLIVMVCLEITPDYISKRAANEVVVDIDVMVLREVQCMASTS
jgi:hypothetical protein